MSHPKDQPSPLEEIAERIAGAFIAEHDSYASLRSVILAALRAAESRGESRGVARGLREAADKVESYGQLRQRAEAAERTLSELQQSQDAALRACQPEPTVSAPPSTPDAEAIRGLVSDLDFAIDVTEPRDVILRRFADILERSPLWR
jgi:hypothetical protein